MTNSEMESYIHRIVTNIHFTPSRLAICNAFYNAEKPLTLKEVAIRIRKAKRSQVPGILSKLAQVIDYSGDPPGPRYGFTGYSLFFERTSDGLYIIRAEFKNVLDKLPTLKNAMECPLENIYKDYKYGLQ